MKLLKGSIVALVTPFIDDAEQSVNREKLAELVTLHADSKTSAIVPCSTTGESPTLLKEEWDAVVSTVIRSCPKYQSQSYSRHRFEQHAGSA